jgi:hypothetical protein
MEANHVSLNEKQIKTTLYQQFYFYKYVRENKRSSTMDEGKYIVGPTRVIPTK